MRFWHNSYIKVIYGKNAKREDVKNLLQIKGKSHSGYFENARSGQKSKICAKWLKFCAICQVLTSVFVRFVILFLRRKYAKLKTDEVGVLCPFVAC